MTSPEHRKTRQSCSQVVLEDSQSALELVPDSAWLDKVDGKPRLALPKKYNKNGILYYIAIRQMSVHT
jgi:hypothetical protein